jgi:hypothetical protein
MRIEKAQNFRVQMSVTQCIEKSGAPELPEESAHFREGFIDAAMFQDGLLQQVGLFLARIFPNAARGPQPKKQTGPAG